MHIVGERGIRGFDGTPGMPGENSRPAPKGEKGKLRKICVLRRFSTYLPIKSFKKKERFIFNNKCAYLTFYIFNDWTYHNLMESTSMYTG